jgi:hypothetical protein
LLIAWHVDGVAARPAPPICDTPKPLLNDPKRGFSALRVVPEPARYWVAKPFLDHAKCDVWISARTIADNVHCVANDRLASAVAKQFYQTTEHEIDACLVTVKDGDRFGKSGEPVSMPLLKGAATSWILDTDTL